MHTKALACGHRRHTNAPVCQQTYRLTRDVHLLACGAHIITSTYPCNLIYISICLNASSHVYIIAHRCYTVVNSHIPHSLHKLIHTHSLSLTQIQTLTITISRECTHAHRSTPSEHFLLNAYALKHSTPYGRFSHIHFFFVRTSRLIGLFGTCRTKDMSVFYIIICTRILYIIM